MRVPLLGIIVAGSIVGQIVAIIQSPLWLLGYTIDAQTVVGIVGIAAVNLSFALLLCWTYVAKWRRATRGALNRNLRTL